MEKLISCIITTKNEEKSIERVLKSIINQSYKNFEIIVVDHPQTSDKTAKIAKKHTKNVFIKGPERSIQRNYAVSKAEGKYVLILDADMVLTKNVLTECVKKFEKDDGLGALVIPEKSFGKGYWTKCRAFEREFYVGEPSIEAARCFKKNTFLKFGGYDETITGPEDYDLPLRIRKAGNIIGRIKSYILHNEKRFSPIKSAKKKFYYAAHAKTYLKSHPEMAIKQGNLVFRPVYLRKWRKFINHPILGMGMFVIKWMEFAGALSGIAYSVILNKEK